MCILKTLKQPLKKQELTHNSNKNSQKRDKIIANEGRKYEQHKNEKNGTKGKLMKR